ncbi:carbohydrate ABC transporter permease [Alkalihalobacillus sp. BA299]|uniref:carbohydrate ABC transporter permease n=1 Tax=Alkalihalobacillus sp. BA299 TaxID=2815938 RepID=UPI001AD97895|nr:sugar ABC transporter permease [Alkalihalobacillus sp. BA299]
MKVSIPIRKSNVLERKKKKVFLSYKTSEKIKDFSLILPALFLLTLFTYYPLINTLYLSFTKWDFIKPTKNFVGLKNYEWIFTNDLFYKVLLNTLWYTVLDVVLTLSIGIVLAILFDKISKVFSVMRLIIFMPHYISMVISAMIFIWIFNGQYGVLNQTLTFFGIDTVNWLNNPSTAMIAIVIVSVWKGVGYSMIIFLAGLRGIPKDYYEAAEIDGANHFKKFRFITLPLLTPITLFLLITSILGSMQVFQSVDVMTGGGPLDATNVLVFWIYEMAFGEFRAGRASAAVMILFAILIALTVILMKVSKRKVHYER